MDVRLPDTLHKAPCSAVSDLHAMAFTTAKCVQGVETRINVLMTAISSCFTSKRLAVIIDDVWDWGELDRLGLLRNCRSSLMVTSRTALPPTSVEYVGFNITSKDNRAQEEAILASYVAANPAVDTIQPHLKVQHQCMHCWHHLATLGRLVNMTSC
jgi:hypothetical protein